MYVDVSITSGLISDEQFKSSVTQGYFHEFQAALQDQ